MYSAEIENKIVVVGISARGPAARAGLARPAMSFSLSTARRSPAKRNSTASSGRSALAGVDVPLTVYHEGVTFNVVLASTDRAKMLKAPRLHQNKTALPTARGCTERGEPGKQSMSEAVVDDIVAVLAALAAVA